MASRLTTTQCDQEIAGSTPVSVILFSSHLMGMNFRLLIKDPKVDRKYFYIIFYYKNRCRFYNNLRLVMREPIFSQNMMDASATGSSTL